MKFYLTLMSIGLEQNAHIYGISQDVINHITLYRTLIDYIVVGLPSTD